VVRQQMAFRSWAQRSSIIPWGLAAVVALGLSGCGNGGTCDVRGTVKFKDGTPLTRGSIHFEGTGRAAHGTIQPDGSFVMSSYKEGDGVMPGTYQVFIDNTEDPMVWDEAKKAYRYGQPRIATKYSAAATSGLKFDVKGRENFAIEVEPFAPSSGTRVP